MSGRRLHRLFRRVVWTVLAASELALPFVACSDSSSTSSGATSGSGGGDGGPDVAADRDCTGVHYAPDAPHNCGEYLYYPCGVPPDAHVRKECLFEYDDCVNICGNVVFNCHAAPDSCDAGILFDDDGGMSVECEVCLNPDGIGRLPEGLVARRARRPRSVAEHLARSAGFEAASIRSFTRLERELASFGAPSSLLGAVRRAGRDERRHARRTREVARARGGSSSPARVKHVAPRSLEALAIENAVEGCVKETFGALVATFQSERATAREIRALFGEIARDEARHAAVAFDVAAFCAARLGPRSRARVAAAFRDAVRGLAAEAPLPHEARSATLELAARLGRPDARARRALAAALDWNAWSQCLSDSSFDVARRNRVTGRDSG